MSQGLDQSTLAALIAREPRLLGPSRGQRAVTMAAWTLFGAALLAAAWRTGFLDLARIANGIGRLGWLFGFMFPPAHHGWLAEFLDGLGETLAMAFFGTLLAFVIALPLGFLAARNVIGQFLAHFTLRRGLDGLRGVDTLIWALIFVNVVGLGPFAGLLAIAMADIGTLAKLFAEAIENVDRRQIDGVRSTGGGRLQVLRYGIVPQVLPIVISNVLYFFESNTRSATILGVVGAGGIGQLLSDRIRVNDWDEAAFIILMILATVAVIDLISGWLRARVIGGRGS
jgi:phosphonate transport system permease protein